MRPPSNPDHPRSSIPAFTLCVLMLAACTIGMVWLVLDFPDRAEIPNYSGLVALAAFGFVVTLTVSTRWATEPDDHDPGTERPVRISVSVVLGLAAIAIYAALHAWVSATSGDRLQGIGLGIAAAVFAAITASQARRYIDESHMPRRTPDVGGSLVYHLFYVIPLAHRALPIPFQPTAAVIVGATAFALMLYLFRRRGEIVETLPPDPPLLPLAAPGVDALAVVQGEEGLEETEEWEAMPEIRRLL